MNRLINRNSIYESIDHRTTPGDTSTRFKLRIISFRLRKICLSLSLCTQFGTACFLIVGTVIGILTICLTVPRQQDRLCEYIFNTTIGHRIGYNSRPRSATVTDLNNDNILDIVIANSGTDNIGIFYGYENGTFRSQITYTAGSRSQPFAVVVGDFNNDNQSDIVSINHGTNSIGLLLGYGNETFKSVLLYSVGSSRPFSAIAAHLNNDIHLDIILVNYDTSSIDILFGYGNGSFSIQEKYSTGYDSHPCFVAVADLNQDNHMDIVTANWGTNNVAIFLGHPNGMFSLIKLYSTGIASKPSSVAIGHLNGDNKLDIVVSNYATSTIGVFLGHGNGTFAEIKRSFIDSRWKPYSMIIGDFNNDKILDVAVANSPGDNIVVLRGLGNGTFINHEIHLIEYGAYASFIVAGDFNKDYRLDLATINNGTNSISVFQRYLVKGFENQVMYSTGAYVSPLAVSVGDLNRDHFLDIVVANNGLDKIYILFGNGNGAFTKKNTFSARLTSTPYKVDVVDFNKDSFLDIVVVNTNINNIGIFLGYGNGTFKEQKTFSTGSSSNPYDVAVGDFNNDSVLDIVVANFRTNNIGLFLGYGDGNFMEQKIFSTGNFSGPQSVAVGDFNNDSGLDIVVSNTGTNNIGIFLGYGDGTFTQQTTFSTNNDSSPRSVAVGDFNNDNFLDITVANYLADNVGVFLGCSNGSFGPMTAYFMGYGSNPSSVVSGDFDNDNAIDIAVCNSGKNNVAVLYGFGNGTFGIMMFSSTGYGSQPTLITTGNLNNDIWLDIVVVNRGRSGVGVILQRNIIDAANQQTYSTGSGSYPYSIVVSDFNNDNQLDLLIVNSAYDDVGICLGYGNGTFTDEITYSTISGSRPTFATAGDFNNNNHMDIVIVNTMNDSITIAYGTGNGTFTNQEVHSTGNNSRPQFAAVSDLNNDSRLDLVTL